MIKCFRTIEQSHSMTWRVTGPHDSPDRLIIVMEVPRASWKYIACRGLLWDVFKGEHYVCSLVEALSSI